MEYAIEDISPIKKKINVSLDAQEVEAAIAAAVAMYRTSVQLDGFRKGKAPQSVLVSKFGDALKGEAMGRIIEKSVTEILFTHGPVGNKEIQLLKSVHIL